MDVFSLHKLGKDGIFFLQHDGTKPLQLTFLFPEDIYLEAVFHLGTYIRQQQFETFVENRLRGNVELDGRNVLLLKRYIEENMPEGEGRRKELPVPVHIRRIQPDGGVGRKKADEVLPSLIITIGLPCRNVRIDIGRRDLLHRKLRVAVEGIDLVYLVSEEIDTVRLFQRIGEDVYDGPAHGKLPGGAHKIHLFKPFLDEPGAKGVVGNLISHLERQEGAAEFLGRWKFLFQGLRISYYIKEGAVAAEEFSHRCRTLHAEGGFVVAALYALSGLGKKKHTVPFHHIVKVCAAVLGRLAGRKNHKMGSRLRNLGKNRPAGRQKKPAAKYFISILKFFLQER